ncbi:MAG: flagellar filament capping protein FliD [Myxococcota bacterium]
MEPLATFSGIASGIDSGALIEQLVQLEQIPIRRLQTRQQDIQSVSRRLGEIQSRLEAVKSAGEGLSSRDEILGAIASSSAEERIGVSATGDAPIGTYRIDVTQLAAAERTYSNGFADATTSGLFGTGTVSIQVGTDAAIDIDVDATDTLNSIALKISNSDARVNAAVIFDGTTHRLQVSGQDTGANNAVTFTETGTSLGLDDPANELVAAQDAVFSVDGLAMTRSSNQVADAIPGVTLDLLNTSDGTPTTVKVDRDTEASVEKIQTFVDAFNEVVRGINSEFVFSGAARVGDSLSGDSMLRNLQSQLNRSITDPVSGLSEPYDRLSALGIRLNNDGTLELDDAELTAALADDPDAVVEFLSGNDTVTGFLGRLETVVDAFADSEGIIASRQDAMSAQVDDLDISIANMELRLEKFEENLRNRFTNLEVVVSGLNSQQQQLTSILSQLG